MAKVSQGGAAVSHRRPEQPRGDGRQHLVHNAPAAGALAEDGHLGRISPEGRDVVGHPLQGQGLVAEALSRDNNLPKCIKPLY